MAEGTELQPVSRSSTTSSSIRYWCRSVSRPRRDGSSPPSSKTAASWCGGTQWRVRPAVDAGGAGRRGDECEVPVHRRPQPPVPMGDDQDLGRGHGRDGQAQHGGDGQSLRPRLPTDRERGRHDDLRPQHLRLPEERHRQRPRQRPGALRRLHQHRPRTASTSPAGPSAPSPSWSRTSPTAPSRLKIYKSLGLDSKDGSKGERIPVNDPRLDPVWAKCGELGIPVLIHTGEPASSGRSARPRTTSACYELIERPGRYRDAADEVPSPGSRSWASSTTCSASTRDDVHQRPPRLAGQRPRARLGELMDELPNMYTEIGAVLAELGRQPRFAREWFIRTRTG